VVSGDVGRGGHGQLKTRAGGEITRLFKLHWGDRTASGAARKALETLIPMLPRSSMPVNVAALAKLVGIEHVVEDDLAEVDGLLSVTPAGTYVATLKRGQSWVRKRFTLAHEIGHVVVYRSATRPEGAVGADRLLCHAGTASNADEERLCDTVATELLMPRESFLQSMENYGVSARTIPLIARQFGVSLQAASRRIASTLSYEIGVSLWGMSDAQSHFVPKWYVTKKGAMELPYAIDVRQRAGDLFSDMSIRGWQWLPLQGQMEKYFIDLQPLPSANKSWLLVVVFGDSASQVMTQIGRSRIPSGGEQLPLVEE
jgi:hypothetical protein